ncbi:unnamed protein product [Phaedon cochleariae]|uniref:Survival of motor neuron-related-splicing factor 30 n=1 Tax=Phaedon cochleariae TaxID=80249 RepID=A0A9P0DTJ5_PHACE|nr:unnamed protein product [Phaedon cochleariae]
MVSVLGPEWHISASGSDIITENGAIKDKQKIYQNALNTDIKEMCSSVLSSELLKNNTSKIVLQIQKVRNISAPKANEDSQAAPRMLKLSLSDGDTYVQALELSPITSISRNNTPPGTKIVVNCAKVCSGYLLLSPNNCTVLGGKVPALIEKWEIAKSVQRTNRRGLNDDGPPPWVNFGKRIQSGNQEPNFKSLENKSKETSKENAEFEAQRQGAIAEANSGAVKKVFGGMVKQNVQPTQNKGPDRSRDKRESFRNKNRVEREDELEKPLKPEKVSLFSFLEDKLPGCDPNDASSKDDDTLFRRKMKIPKEFQKPRYDDAKFETDTFPKVQKNSYSSVKHFESVPVKQQNPMDNIGFYKNHKNQNLPQDNSKNHFNSVNEKYQPKTHNSNLREQSDRPQKKPYDNRGYNSRTGQSETFDTQKPHENRGYNNRFNQNDVFDTKKPYDNRRYNNGISQKEASNSQKPYENQGYNSRTSKNEVFDTKKNYDNGGHKNGVSQNEAANTRNPNENRDYNNHNNESEAADSQRLNNPNTNRTQPKQSDNKNTQLNRNKYQNQNEYGKSSHKSRENDNQRIYEKPQKSFIPPNPTNNHDQSNTNQNKGNMDDLTQGMEKITVNSQFASRSIRQHLNLGGQKKNEENLKKNEETNSLTWNIGDECLAKYWEDGKFYEATIMAITDKTVAVKFRGYGNIEEILTDDCLPTKHSNISKEHQGEQNRKYEQNSRSYSGSMQFRRTPKNNYNNW